MSTIGRTGDILEGTHAVPNYPDPATQNVNSLPMGFAYGEGNYLFDTTAPSVPGTPTSPGKTTTTIAIVWAASSDAIGVDHYNIYVGSNLAGSTKNLTATLSGLTTGTLYNIKVSAVDKHGNESAKSGNLAVTTN